MFLIYSFWGPHRRISGRMESLSILETQESATDGREGVLCEWQFKILETAFWCGNHHLPQVLWNFTSNQFLEYWNCANDKSLRWQINPTWPEQRCALPSTHVLRKIRLGFALCHSRMVDLLSRRIGRIGGRWMVRSKKAFVHNWKTWRQMFGSGAKISFSLFDCDPNFTLPKMRISRCQVD